MAAPTDSQKISAETLAGALDGTEYGPVVQGGANRRQLNSQLLTYINANISPSINVSLNSHKITNLTDPTAAQDAATKTYVDAVATLITNEGLRAPCRAATTAALATVVYANGASGVGATLTGAALGALGAIDGVTLIVADRLLVKNQVAALQNGIYTVTAVGNAGAVFVLTRATDYDTSAEIFAGTYAYITEGTVNGSGGFIQTATGALTIGTDSINFTQFTGAGEITAGTGLSKSGNTLSLTTPVTAANGGTGVSNAGTITNASNTTITGGGTLALGGFTLTAPATGTAALLATANAFTAVQNVTVTDAVTNTTTIPLVIGHDSSGTPANSFGVAVKMTLHSTTTLDRDAAEMEAVWSTAADATRSSNLVWYLVSSASALTERMRLSASGNLTISNAFLSAAGTVSAPGHSFSSDTDTGLYSVSANVMAVTGGGVESARFADTSVVAAAAIVDVLTLRRNPGSGTPATGDGPGLLFAGKSTTTADRSMLEIAVPWATATDASRKARATFNIYDTAAREALRLEASGSAALIGFLGATAVGVQTLGAAATDAGTTQTLANNLRTALINLGLGTT